MQIYTFGCILSRAPGPFLCLHWVVSYICATLINLLHILCVLISCYSWQVEISPQPTEKITEGSQLVSQTFLILFFFLFSLLRLSLLFVISLSLKMSSTRLIILKKKTGKVSLSLRNLWYLLIMLFLLLSLCSWLTNLLNFAYQEIICSIVNSDCMVGSDLSLSNISKKMSLVFTVSTWEQSCLPSGKVQPGQVNAMVTSWSLVGHLSIMWGKICAMSTPRIVEFDFSLVRTRESLMQAHWGGRWLEAEIRR